MTIDVRDHGAVGDGQSLDTPAFEAAFAACARAGGGTVSVTAGTYLVAPLRLRSNLTLNLAPGAVLRFTDDFSAYPIVRTRWAGYVCHALQPCLYADGADNVAVTGYGTIDGCGQAWWEAYRGIRNGSSPAAPQYDFERELAAKNAGVDTRGAVWGEWSRQFLRPPLLQFKDCGRVLLEGVTLRNSPFWNTHILFSDDVTVANVRFENPPDAPNGDGLDIDSSTRVRVANCSFDVNDDCLCLKSGIDANGRAVGRPTTDVVVTNCTMYRGHGGVVMGSDTAGGIQGVVISNCVFRGTDRGLRIKSRRGRGGCVEDIRATNIVMDEVLCPLVVNLYYTCGASGELGKVAANPERLPVDEGTPAVRGVTLANITARRASVAAAALVGLPESPLRDICLRDVSLETVGGGRPLQAAMSFHCSATAGAGLLARHTQGLRLNQVSIHAADGRPIDIHEASDTRLSDCLLEGTEAHCGPNC
jgi:polygalacturonase